MVYILMFAAIGLFIFLQSKRSNRNLDHFESTREKYEQLLEQLRKKKDQEEERKNE